ncbi:MAG: ABC transporter permease [Betaproteobacteria bacterium]|nr:ABC transporter permease [Betaproteobacteria bacterium]MBI3054625.1 ABC transporter permease [Betaproteobacteria bacterium]
MRLGFIVERLLQLIPVLIGISLVVFLMMALTPGDPVEIMLGDQLATAEQKESLRRDMGLDLPVAERFVRFVKNALGGDFGRSFFHRRPVAEVIAERLPATIELTIVAMLIALAVAIPLGVLAAVRRGSLIDKAATVISLIGVSMPGFWLGIMLILLFAVHLGWMPVSGRIDYAFEVPRITGMILFDSLVQGRYAAFLNALHHILMPAVTLGLAMAALLMRVTRTSMIEVLQQDYIVFAEAKGLSRARVLVRHALKNALIPTVTVAALETGYLLGGNTIVEMVFGWPGLARVIVEGIYSRDFPLVQAGVLVIAVIYVTVNFAADVLYTLLNPRVKL